MMVLLALSGCATTKDFYGLSLINNSQAKDVSSEELVKFLQSDPTNYHPIVAYTHNSKGNEKIHEFVTSGYECLNFSVDLHNNAENAGIRCAVVVSSEQSHAFNAFQVTEGELVFVDASSGYDTLIEVSEGYTLVEYYKIREGVGDTCIIMLGNPKDFKVEW